MLLQNLLGWLRRFLFRSRYEYIDLGDGYFLKVKRNTAAIVTADEVPTRILRPTETPTMQVARDQLDTAPELPTTSRISLLKRLLPFEVARRATSSDKIRDDVLQHPELVDADSDLEAQLKLAIAAGDPIEPLLNHQPDLTENELSDMLGPEWVANWGYNTYGSALPEHLTRTTAADAGQAIGSNSKSATRSAGKARAIEGRKTVHARDISNNANRVRPQVSNRRPSSSDRGNRPTVKARDIGSGTSTPSKRAGDTGSTDSSTIAKSGTSASSSGRPSHAAADIGSSGTSSTSHGGSESTQGGTSSSGSSVGGGDVGGGTV